MGLPCSKANDYVWCRELPIVYRSRDNEDFCLFHAPAGHKMTPFVMRRGDSALIPSNTRLTIKQFNDEVFKRIDSAKAQGVDCNLSGTIFEGPISFDQYDEENPLPKINLSGSQFMEEAAFLKVEFGGDVNFYNAKFTKGATYSGALFKGLALFSLAEFYGEAFFVESTFENDVDFLLAKFKEDANFSLVVFSAEHKINFTSAEFYGSALFIENQFGLADFSFSNWISDDVRFEEVSFNQQGIYENVKIKSKARFERADLSRVSFMDTDVAQIDFINCTWSVKYGRRVLYDELLLKKVSHSDLKNYMNKVEGLYRKLKLKYKLEHDEFEVSNWHYGEKEMYRKKNTVGRYLGLAFFYWLSSGYGERPWRSGVVLSCLSFIIFPALLSLVGLYSLDERAGSGMFLFGVNDVINNYWTLVLTTLQYATFEKAPDYLPITLPGKFLKIMIQVLIPTQTALFLLAVRNRFRR